MDSTWEIKTAFISVQLDIISDKWIRYLKGKGLTDRRTKSKITEASNEFEELYKKYCELKEVGQVDLFEAGLADKLMVNFSNNVKLKALDIFVTIVSDIIKQQPDDRISMHSFYNEVSTKAQERAQSLIGYIKAYTHDFFEN